MTLFHRLAPFMAVFLWSTGFIVAAEVASSGAPHRFLAIRLAMCAVIFFVIAFFIKKSIARGGLSRNAAFWRLLLIGIFTHGIYLSGAFWTIMNGLPSGVMALIGALQPPLTALLTAYFHKEKHAKMLWLGLALGFTGVVFAVIPLLNGQNLSGSISPQVVMVAFVAMFAITIGTFLQKSSVAKIHFVPSNSIQYTGGFLVVMIMAFVLREPQLEFDLRLLAVLGYSTFILSIGGFSLLLFLIRSGNVTQVTSLLFMVPPLAAIQAYILFDQKLNFIQIAGFVIALTGVYLAHKSKTPEPLTEAGASAKVRI